MPLKFSDVCDLLRDLEKQTLRISPPSRNDLRKTKRSLVESWFKRHRTTIDAPSANGVALLSTLFPEKRVDRTYALQEARLSRVMGRCLYLTAQNLKQLQEYREPGQGGLAECLERLLRPYDAEKTHCHVTVNEVDSALESIAARCRFSAPEILLKSTPDSMEEILGPVVRSMRSYEAKWFVRLVLKDFSPVVLEYWHTLATYHFLLPELLRFQNSFAAAVALLKEPLKQYHANPNPASQRLHRNEAAQLIRPRIGIKLGQPFTHKARSMDHCLQMANRKRWSAELKYDGEYCEIHIALQQDISKRIKIFSKSGKDSTEDRAALHQTITECLRLGDSDCKFNRECILVGELVVWSDESNAILPFHKIRKHVSRAGSFLGTDEDSQPHPYEHLMIIFFDVLMVDDEATLTKPHKERRQTLRHIVKKIPGRAITSAWRIIDFSSDSARETLAHHFTASIACRNEGLVLKPADAPYFSLTDDRHCGFIKLKKDYMQGFGEERDVVDLVVVGASYNPRHARRSMTRGLQWTTFHLGCLANPDDVRFERLPVFKVVCSIGEEHCIPPPELLALNNIVKFGSFPIEKSTDGSSLENPRTFDLKLDQSPDCSLTHVLTEPVVVEMLGSGYEKPPNKNFMMLRHPRILKVHHDHSWKDAATVDGLAEMAEAACSAPPEGESQEMTRLLQKLERKMTRKAERGELRSSMTPRTATTRSTVSPRSPLATMRYQNNDAIAPGSSPLRSNPITRVGTRGKRATPPVFVRVDTCEQLSNASASRVIHDKLPMTKAVPLAQVFLNPPTSSAYEPENQNHTPKELQQIAPTINASKKRRVAIKEQQIAYRPSKRIKVQHNSEATTGRAEALCPLSPSKASRLPCSQLPSSGITNSPDRRSTLPVSIEPEMAEEPNEFPDVPQRVAKRLKTLKTQIERPKLLMKRILSGAPASLSTNESQQETDTAAPACHRLPKNCMFLGCMFYLSPCVAGMKYLTENLIPEHGGFIINNLAHWTRQSSPVDPDADYVPESPAYPDVTKIVLVERKRQEQSMEMVQNVVQLGIREKVEFVDWRVLEAAKAAEESAAARGVLMPDVERNIRRESFFGVTWWDSDGRKVRWSDVNRYAG
ncbi:hypothetical protein NA57DRAFT_78898 [Rhizodiscina lignyota]|uniref:ATP-dependent DNA ligase family profile domain-containing protein n=1 Tax=Rhizodiscina lignyota TaxID=1504668 RepID=A0A9P4I6Y9_9PEZI|nr:hypothetical protein NA57DRAFT_78898 [Rhizodiscina lignyota]